MDSRLIADRHPVLGRLYRLWLARRGDAPMPTAEAVTQHLADLGDVIVVAYRPCGTDTVLRIGHSGKLIDQLYGMALSGQPLGWLTPSSEDADNEATVVLESGRTLMIEDQIRLANGLARMSRLYLPFADADGDVGGIVVGIAKAS